MSDFEINKAVAEIRYREAEDIPSQDVAWVDNDTECQVIIEVGRRGFTFDPCNNPSDAWPIIEQVWSTLMSITSYDYNVGVGESKTTIWDARAHAHNDGKLRAACIVYLMMQEAE